MPVLQGQDCMGHAGASSAGAAVFVRYSMAQFLRFWLARLSYEQQRQTDRVVEAIKQ